MWLTLHTRWGESAVRLQLSVDEAAARTRTDSSRGQSAPVYNEFIHPGTSKILTQATANGIIRLVNNDKPWGAWRGRAGSGVAGCILDIAIALITSRCSSVVEQCFRKAWAVSSILTTGSFYSTGMLSSQLSVSCVSLQCRFA